MTGVLSAALDAQALACDSDSEMELSAILQATAEALAEAIAQTEITCEANGGEDTEACGFVQAEVETIARAQVCFPRANNAPRPTPLRVTGHH